MSFTQIAGNHDAIDRLRKMVAEGRVPSSLLLSGPDGSGKLLAALNLAKVLNCARATEGADDACDQCPACLRIEQGSFADVHRIGPEGAGRQVKAESVRRAVTESPFRPFEGKKRVYIFEEADRMNETSANTLLKTLEEPPPWAVLVLLTAHEAAILPTLLSRCQKIRFHPLLPGEVAEVLARKQGVSLDQARLAAGLSGGNLTRAEAALDEELDDLRTEALRIASVPAQGLSRAELISWATGLAKAPQLTSVLRLDLCLLRDLAAVATGEPTLHTQLTNDFESMARRVRLGVWLDAYRQVEEALRDIEVRYTNKRITLEKMLFNLAGLRTETVPPAYEGSSHR